MPDAVPESVSDPAQVLKKTHRAWKIARIAGILLVIFFIPSIRSCGARTLGLPFVAVSEKSTSGFQVHYANLVLNLSIAALVIAAATLSLKAVKRDETMRLLCRGFDFVGIYVAFVVCGFLFLYPRGVNASDGSFMASFLMGYTYFIYPWFDSISDIANSIPSAVASSPLFGDSYDLPMRALFLLMCLAWFGLGCLTTVIGKIFAKLRGRPVQPRP